MIGVTQAVLRAAPSQVLRGFALLAAALLLAGLGGCASAPSGGNTTVARGDGRTDIVTESDEPESRKRARVRLELAGGYFEQGQTTVALDELKQALTADPNFADAHNLRGLIYMRLNDPRLAEEGFRRAQALAPVNGDIAHNYGWFLCLQQRYGESFEQFNRALSNATYGERAKTLMAQGLCEIRAGRRGEAERSLSRAYELDAANPVVGFNLANLLYQRGDFARAQFYTRRLNNGEFANAETLWLGIRVERQLNDRAAMEQLATQLKRRFPASREAALYDRGAFNE